jgi:predicted Fe-Mo cluster-binding NifX family protein
MKVLVAASGAGRESAVARRFGHAPYYLCVDPATDGMDVIENREDPDRSHAMIPGLVARGVDVFITGNIGPHAFEMIRSLGARVAMARKMSVDQALTKLQKGELTFLDKPTLAHSVHEHAERPARSGAEGAQRLTGGWRRSSAP